MDPERRHLSRRLLSGGIVLGALAAALLALTELILSAAGTGRSTAVPLASTSERALFMCTALSLSITAGALLGAIEGGAVWLATNWSNRLANTRRRRRLEAKIYTLLLAPAVTFTVARLLSGRRVRLLPAHHLIVLSVILLALAGIYLLLRILARYLDRFAARPRSWLLELSVTLILLAVALIMLWANYLILPRLYIPFHIALELLSFALIELGLGMLYLALLARRVRTVGSIARPAVAITMLIVGISSAALSLGRLQRNEAVQAAMFADLGSSSHLLDLAVTAHLVNLTDERRQTPAATGQTTVAAPPLPPGPRFPGADVFLISIDAMRADRLTPRTAPRLSALAASSVVFDQAYTPVPHTSFALASLLTGKYVSSLATLGQDPDLHETLAQVFIRDRYKTAAFFPPSVFYIDHERFAQVEKSGYHFEYVKYEYMGARGRTDQVIKFLDDEHPQRVFAWVHYFDPHEPYDVHDGILPGGRVPRTAVERYDGEIMFVDREVGRLIGYLQRTRPGAIIVLTADHGEEFGDHGGRYHGSTLYEEQVHVPLFIHVPGLAPRHISFPVSLIDLAPTLLGLVDIMPSARMRGQDLGPWFMRDLPLNSAAPVFAEIGSQKMVAVGHDRLLCDLTRSFCEFYDLASDPAELRNLAGREIERQRAARAYLDGWLTSQSNFERSHGEISLEESRLLLERGRQGDGSVSVNIAGLLASPRAELREQATAILLKLPPAPPTRAAVEQARRGSTPPDLRLDIIAYRLGNTSLAPRLADCHISQDPKINNELVAYAGLALAAQEDARALPLMLEALSQINNETMEKQLLLALGASPLKDPRITPALLVNLEHVRTRVETIRALGARHDPSIAVTFARTIDQEPYVIARAEMARVLGELGNPVAILPLRELKRRETETVVKEQITSALARLTGKPLRKN